MKTDAELRQHVIDELYSEPSLDATTIAVTADNGVVTLTGYVGSYPQIATAEHVAQRVLGVRGVLPEMRVVLPYESFRTDFEINEEALFALKWNALVPEDCIHVTVEHACATLTGTVNYAFQKQAAENAVSCLVGVKSVVDLVTVGHPAGVQEVREEIERTLHRTIDHQLRELEVEANGGVITLRGEAGSWLERDEVERAALKQHGVSEVHNEMLVAS
ncbi:MAG TPA: BON domain-containing protein [Fimbriimonadaceae bacterium]|nr:BON domain-containing protein [Fimbriimonadaceae bacterium]